MIATNRPRFIARGVVGFVSLILGMGIAFLFRKSSVWPESTKHAMIALAYCLAFGGLALFTSYRKQATFKQLKTFLFTLVALLGIFLSISIQ